MAVLKEYRCQAHGEFEGYSPVCPYGCSARFVRQEIRTAPSLKGAQTTNIDANLRDLSNSYRMTDIRNDPKSGTSVMEEMRKGNFRTQWADVPHAAPGFSERKDAATVNAGAFGVQPDSALQPGTFKQPVPMLRKDARGNSDLGDAQ